MADVIGCKVFFDTVVCDCALRNHHYSSIVDQDIDGWDGGPGEEFSCCGTDGCLTGEVHLEDVIVDIWILGLEGIDAGLDLAGVTTHEDEVGWSLRCLQFVGDSAGSGNGKNLPMLLRLRNRGLRG